MSNTTLAGASKTQREQVQIGLTSLPSQKVELTSAEAANR
jgi:hypothetical protein